MYVYNYRAFDLYEKPVVSLAILGDERLNWRPNTYHFSFGGCESILKFPMIKLLDYESQEEELAVNPNPFAIIVIAHLKTKATTGNPEKREEWKWSLVRGLYNRGLEREQIIKLFQIIDRMMTLPNSLQESLNVKIQKLEETRTMPLLSNMELKGMERGTINKARQDVKRVLEIRFGDVFSEVGEALMEVSDVSVLDELLELAVTANSLEDFKQRASFDK
jgi:hypothetical protein